MPGRQSKDHKNGCVECGKSCTRSFVVIPPDGQEVRLRKTGFVCDKCRHLLSGKVDLFEPEGSSLWVFDILEYMERRGEDE